MKSVMIAIPAILLFLSACGTLESPETRIEGNTFISSTNPNLTIEFPTDFKYLGTVDKPQWTETTYVDPTPLTTKTDRKFYFYGQLLEDNFLPKFFSVTVLTLPVGIQWAEEPFRIKNPLKREVVKLGRNDFQCCIAAAETTDAYSEQYFLEKGITTPECYIRMMCKKVFGANVKVVISYYEDVSKFDEFEINSCLEWYNKMTFNNKQKDYFEDFEKRVYKSIRVL